MPLDLVRLPHQADSINSQIYLKIYLIPVGGCKACGNKAALQSVQCLRSPDD